VRVFIEKKINMMMLIITYTSLISIWYLIKKQYN